MKFKLGAKLGVLAVTACLSLSAFSAFADDEKVSVSFKDVTASSSTTLTGEAKILVSVSGAEGSATIAQLTFGYTGGLKYKSTEFLKGENNPPSNYWIAVPTGSGKLSTSILSLEGLDFSDDEELFILTFKGKGGDSVTLSLADLDTTYCIIDGEEKYPVENTSITVKASEKENQGKDAVVRLVMDDVLNFAGSGKTGIIVTVTSETNSGYTMRTEIENKSTDKGGHRDTTTSVPTFVIDNTVVDDDTYTVSVYAAGYVPFTQKGVTFDKELKITNADFIPGDADGDGDVDKDDLALVKEYIKNEEYAESADFNRDGSVDDKDLAVFEDIDDGDDKNDGKDDNKDDEKDDEDDGKKVPEKLDKPTVAGGSKKLTVKWTKPDDDSVTGYAIRYGTTETFLTKSVTISSADTLSTEITGLSASTTYYLQIAAVNKNGTGTYSQTVSAKTSAENAGGGGGGGGGASGGGSSGGASGGSSGGASSGGSTGSTGSAGSSGSTGSSAGTVTPTYPTYPTTPSSPTYTETFTDLENHVWAKDSIYALKEKGIISGISETLYAPASNIKRGDFILILTRMLGINGEFTENFADVPETSYYYNAIGSAKAAGIAKGSGENFMPENPITREDLITLAYRAFAGMGYISEAQDLSALDGFADKGEISDYAQSAMASMVGAGIIKGDNGNVNPKGYATRAEVAVMCARMSALMY